MSVRVEKKAHEHQQELTRAKHELADIFRLYGADYRSAHRLSKKQHQVMFDIEHCRTAYFGYHIDSCDACGYSDQFYNSCRNRHCPKCQGIARRVWVNARLEDLLPIPYYHVVFTLPHLVNALVGYNRELIYNLLFDCASETLLQFGRDPKWLGALIGFYGILHTWGGKLWQHAHLHFIVAGGGLNEAGRWVTSKYKGKFLFPVFALSKVFRGKFVERFKAAYYQGALSIPDELKHLEDSDAFESWIDALVAKNWVVFAKRPFETPKRVVRYIGRYTHKVAISNPRILSIDKAGVCFQYKDYKDKGRIKETRLSGTEFIRRFLMHVLPNGFHRIRHYGLFANGRCKGKVARIRKLLEADEPGADFTAKDFRPPCPKCKTGRMIPRLCMGRYGMLLLDVLSRYAGNLTLPAWDTS